MHRKTLEKVRSGLVEVKKDAEKFVSVENPIIRNQAINLVKECDELYHLMRCFYPWWNDDGLE